jgi:hypothetical protein
VVAGRKLQDAAQPVVEIVPVATVEEPPKAEHRAVAITEVPSQVPPKGEPLACARRMSRQGEQKYDVWQMPLGVRERAADAPVDALERNVIGRPTSSDLSGLPSLERVVPGAHGTQRVT